MKRLLILVVIFFLGWMIFDRIENMKNKEPEIASQNEKITTEKKDGDEFMDQEGEKDEVDTNKETTKLAFEEKAETLHDENSVDELSEDVKKDEVVVKEQTDNKTAPVVKKIAVKKEDPIVASVKVYMYEWGIDLSRKDVPEGKVSFEVINNGKLSHLFAIDEGQTLGKIIPGSRNTFVVSVKPGTLKLYSPKQIDMEQNMSETLTVTK